MSGQPLLLRRAVDLALLGRPLHLIGGAIFYGLGVAIAHYAGQDIDGPLYLGGQLVVWSCQLMTHYSNEYFDLDADRANGSPTAWSGGSRVLPEGRLLPQVALLTALLFGGLALLLMLPVAAMAPAPLFSLGLFVTAIMLAWLYSSPPLYLNRRGLGEVAGGVLVPGLTALIGFQLQTGVVSRLLLLAIVPLMLMQFAMLLAVNFPDAEGDATVGKRTLVVLLGARPAAVVYIAAVLAAYVSLPLLVLLGLPLPAALALLAVAPIGAWLVVGVVRGAWRDPDRWDGLGFWSIGQLVGGAGMLVLAFVMIA